MMQYCYLFWVRVMLVPICSSVCHSSAPPGLAICVVFLHFSLLCCRSPINITCHNIALWEKKRSFEVDHRSWSGGITCILLLGGNTSGQVNASCLPSLPSCRLLDSTLPVLDRCKCWCICIRGFVIRGLRGHPVQKRTLKEGVQAWSYCE